MILRSFRRHFYKPRPLIFSFLVLLTFLTFVYKVKFSNIHHEPVTTHLSHDQIYVTTGFGGRTGNHMFQYASMVGIARYNNMTPVLVEGTYIHTGFKIPLDIASFSELDAYQTVSEDKAGYFKEELTHLPKESTYLQGYFQSFKYFDHIKEEIIHKHFVFKDIHSHRAKDFLHKVKKEHGFENPVFVGVHIRRGDKVREISKGTGPAHVPFFYRAMNYFTKKYNNVIFVVCSNDVGWCSDNLDSDYYSISYSTEKDGNTDMCILTQCNHTIISVGSYSWWAAYIGGGEVVYNKAFPDPSTDIGSLYNPKDYYPSSWIPM